MGTISGSLGTELDSKSVYGDTDSYIKTKLKMYDNKVNTNFQDKKIPKVDGSYKCLSRISVFLVFLEKCKYVKRKNRMVNYIEDDINIISSDEDDEFFSESNSDSSD